ncbi:hypothetical protein DFP72DRAFT_1166785 [Ephemerocybe angulata]|uniref:Uncharacterized protein n=1 Tax=Ephemerocybe angulata TaxID=980116 RepID=A0A8H6I8R7_9AGAR|nr:hypothetical protein DFP72DRAFT_1166785 [Tulosesus angulatus]
MATPVAAPALAERTDIHKSCKSLENILNILNEYCEAVGVIVALQKKLAKALREAAGLKATGENAANALNGSAAVFEALLEVDTKYTKFADKEYDIISAEVKKWFKKLVKEERAHDQRLEKANARIKQAGQSYEKKSKKNPSDAAEEHARYINLISTLGPEISQEKYNHSLNVTQRHTAATSSVASCLARIADAEWLKVCEGVRLLAPNIGTLTQWRVLCEGGWSESLPNGLPEVTDTNPPTNLQTNSLNTRESSPDIPDSSVQPSQDQEIPATPEQLRQPVSSTASPAQQRYPLPSPQRSPNVSSQNLSQAGTPAAARSRENLPPPSAFDTLKPPFFDPTTGTVRTLSAFPAPPTYLPTPPVRQQTQLSLSSSIQSLASNTSSAGQHFSESPVSANQDLMPANYRDAIPPAITTPSYDNSPAFNHVPQSKASTSSPEQKFQDYIKEEDSQPEIRRPLAVRAPTSPRAARDVNPAEEPSTNEERSNEYAEPPGQQPREPYHRERDASEFGVQRAIPSKAHTYDALRRGVDRTDSLTSNGSVVAAMRDRYSSNPGSLSPTTRELPRIPLKVTDLAARYQAPDSPTFSRPRAVSPPVSRQMSFPLDHGLQKAEAHHHERKTHRPGSSSVSTSTPTIEEDVRRRRQESDLRERERELQDREKEIEARARELERDRAKLMTVHEGISSSSGRAVDEDTVRPPISPLRPRRISLRKQLQRPLSQIDLEESPEPPRQQRPQFSNPPSTPQPSNYQGRYSGQTSPSLQSPSRSANGGGGGNEHRDHRYSEESQSNTSSTATPHAPYCGCHACSASKYGSSPNSSREQEFGRSDGGNALRPPSSPDKPKGGWMRRLSMPGGLSSAFSMDGKRNNSNYSLGSGVSSAALGHQQKKGILSFDGRKNASATNLLRAPTEQDGARRSFDADRRGT